MLKNAELATDERFNVAVKRVENRDALRSIMEDIFAQSSPEEVIARLDEAGIANAKVNDMQGVWEHPQLKARGRWAEIDTPQGRVPALLPPGIASGKDVRMDGVPALGQHNDSILAELGLSSKS